ncbi:methyltransferase domain-containing protein [Sulfitobacter sp. BDSS02]|nr:methyltransferase domain-containing protein [Sulfitobacter sp. BDSS02]MBR9849601.1 methyltransferase domain-containing protein [Paracoccaceae bacterium]
MDVPDRSGRSKPRRGTNWLYRLIAKPAFQAWAAQNPFTRSISRREGADLFNLVQGFTHSQTLLAVVELRLLHRLYDAPATPSDLARLCDLKEPSMVILLQAAAALRLVKRQKDGHYALARKGAALLGVPGLEEMIRHNRLLYRDLEDPVAFLRGETTPEVAAFWPYVFGEGAAINPKASQEFSRLMADSQALVAQEILSTISLKGIKRLLDVAGGSGVFLSLALRQYPGLITDLFDLPLVIDTARTRLDAHPGRVQFHSGDFRNDPLPTGADAISLIRVLFDHQDDTVRALLRKVHEALPPNGRLIIAEPMSGATRPDPATDVYFAFYTKAMGTGRTRSADEIMTLCAAVGFRGLRNPATHRSYVASVVTGFK